MSDLKLLTERLIENKKAEVQVKIKEAEAEKAQLLEESARSLAEEKAKQIN